MQFEYVVLLIRLMQQTNDKTKIKIQEELSIHESILESHEQIRDFLSKVDL